MNPPRAETTAASTKTVDQITQHPTLGPLAPEIEWTQPEDGSRHISGRGYVQDLVNRLDEEMKRSGQSAYSTFAINSID